MPPSDRPAVGDVYKRELLHSEATYRVVEVEDDHVEVETVAAPGLPEGYRMRLTTDALRAMEHVSAPAQATAAEADAQARRDRTAREQRLRLA